MTTFDQLGPPPVPALQNVVEFGGLWTAAAALGARRVVEVGSLYGGTLWYWLQLPDVQRVVSVDQLTDHEPVRDAVVAARAQWSTWAGNGDLLTVEGDSHNPVVVSIVAGWTTEGIDVLFLDGDHTYEGVRADWELWHPLVRPGGLVAFHDTVPNRDRTEPGVTQLVGELKWLHPSTEWFDPDGVGITAFTL